MHFGPYTLQRQVAGSDCVGRFMASRPEESGTKSLLTVDIPTPAARLDPHFVRDFEACIGAALSLDHPNLLPPLEHGVDQGVPYLAHAFIPGRTLLDVDEALRLEGSPWPGCAVVYLLHRTALGLRHMMRQLGPLRCEVASSHILLTTEGDVLVDAFALLGGWQAGHEVSITTDELTEIVKRLGAGMYGGLPPEMQSLLAAPPASVDEWLAEWGSQCSTEGAASLSELLGSLSLGTDPLDDGAEPPDPSEQTDDVPVRRRFRRTQLAPGPSSTIVAETVVQATLAEAVKQPNDMEVAVPRGGTLEMDAVPSVIPPPPPVYGVSSVPSAFSSDPPLARMTVEAPSYDPLHGGFRNIDSSPRDDVIAVPRSRRRRSLGWKKISWMLGCIAAGVLIGLVATAMLGFGPLVASTPDAPLPEARRTDEP